MPLHFLEYLLVRRPPILVSIALFLVTMVAALPGLFFKGEQLPFLFAAVHNEVSSEQEDCSCGKNDDHSEVVVRSTCLNFNRSTIWC